jgi:hypothetical protein
MIKVQVPIAMAAVFLLCACEPKPPVKPSPPVMVEPQKTGWRAEASEPDQTIIDQSAASWRLALDSANNNGFRKKVSAEGDLLDPGAALPFPAPSPGYYMCRSIKLGPPARSNPAFASFKPFFCYVGVDQDQLFLAKQTGTERPSGYLFPAESGNRMIFLGSMAEGRADPIPYGSDPKRDLAGVVERIGPLRFRLVIPGRQAPWRMQVMEMVPAPVQNED